VTDARAVKDANRRLYDAVAARYEELDGRRSPRLREWLTRRLRALRRQCPGGRLLDVGSGGGFLCRCAAGVFERRVGCDLSAAILDANRDAFDQTAVGDADALPFADGSFDAVTCFAVLHHLPSFEGLVSEARRVLAGGGILYTDHDMDAAFHARFRFPLAAYRGLRGAAGRYRRASPQVTAEMYRLAECHETGIRTDRLASLLRAGGFDVDVEYHWFGLSAVTDRVFGERPGPRGWAPLARIVARKTAGGPGKHGLPRAESAGAEF
jgi:SAM-dependent methyltransferase